MQEEKFQDFSEQEWESCIKVLRSLVQDPMLAPDVLVFKGLIKKIYTKAKKGIRAEGREEKRQEDKKLVEQTTIYQNYHEIKSDLNEQTVLDKKLLKPIPCYICLTNFQELHFFYHKICPTCASLNYEKRNQCTDLSGKIALLTGGRIKIGYHTALKLLRDGAKVIVTTRFPKSAALVYEKEPDFEEWKDRLLIYGLDLRNLASVELFVNHLFATETHLDIIIHNAAQTIKRPPEFYYPLLENEKKSLQDLPTSIQNTLGDKDSNQFYLLETQTSKTLPLPNQTLFPSDQLDKDGHQLDLRSKNSWNSKLEEIDTIEMLEVQLANSIAPFTLNSKLKPLLMQSPSVYKFIINVAAKEGQFTNNSKTAFHPHTNMAKAALNMMTRTAAPDYAESNILMNSVDPGWVSQENPYPKKQKMIDKGFVPPLDFVDAAARIYDPIVKTLNNEEIVYGKLLKHYKVVDW